MLLKSEFGDSCWSYVIDGTGELDKEEAFIQRCMDSLVDASAEVEKVIYI